MKVRDIAKLNPLDLQTITPDRPVHEAIGRLVEHNIGALPVCDSAGELVGILTERDILRLCAGQDLTTVMEQSVADAMTTNLIIGVPDDTVAYVMQVMTERRIRHLPILEDRKLVNIISIGDVVKAKLDESSSEIRFLRDYLTQ